MDDPNIYKMRTNPNKPFTQPTGNAFWSKDAFYFGRVKPIPDGAQGVPEF